MSSSSRRLRRRGRPLLITLLVICLAGGAATAALAIVGGQNASQEYSFMGSLQSAYYGTDHKCGAVLIDSTTMLTAEHCVTSLSGSLSVRIGSNSSSTGGELAKVAKALPFDNLRDIDGSDIALLKLAQPVKAAPVRIADSSTPPGTPVRLLGWGEDCTHGGCPTPDGLKELDTTVSSDSSCDEAGAFLPTHELCINSTPSDTACRGDSGGPSLYKDNVELHQEGGEWVLAGLASRPASAWACGEDDTVFTDVSAFRKWIDDSSDGTPQSCDFFGPGFGSSLAPRPECDTPTETTPSGTPDDTKVSDETDMQDSDDSSQDPTEDTNLPFYLNAPDTPDSTPTKEPFDEPDEHDSGEFAEAPQAGDNPPPDGIKSLNGP
ncbi:trypsin-like serine protease [Streptomyces sp. NPDC005728]|uniref:trypsin-like serine protease n=1 Tax=Streptomyces sp. NPDC005728 TaxID=3157054 RepID=UPI0033C3EA07